MMDFKKDTVTANPYHPVYFVSKIVMDSGEVLTFAPRTITLTIAPDRFTVNKPSPVFLFTDGTKVSAIYYTVFLRDREGSYTANFHHVFKKPLSTNGYRTVMNPKYVYTPFKNVPEFSHLKGKFLQFK